MSYGTLYPQHAAMLEASGVTPEQAHARGYRTVDTKARLERVGITRAGRNVPGLQVPLRDIKGGVWGYQYRPDSPRLDSKGKAIKYETPAGQRNGIDVPPGVGPLLGDPTVPLWITEGTKKADAAVCAGLACVALPGVWSWRGKNAHGGKTAVPDWHDVALNDRRVILAFDGDVARKKAVRQALDQLADYLRSKGADVAFCHLPDADDKVGLDDYLVAGHTVDDLWRLVHPEPPPTSEATSTSPSSSDGSDTSDSSDGSEGGYVHRGITLSEDITEDGETLLDEVRAWLARHITVAKQTDLDILTVFAAHTHAAEHLHSTPRLQIDSPVPESGKTTVLEHLERLCRRAVLASSISSSALLARLVAAEPRTLLLDEVDRTLDPKKSDVGELLSILNSGYKVGATRPTLVPVKDGGWEAKELPTFAPVVMAGNQPNLPADTQSRIIRILLLPDWSGRAEESDWEMKDTEASMLGARLARWARQNREEFRPRPQMPPGCTSRFREKWQPLARVARVAGPKWLEVMMRCAAEDVADVAADRDAGLAAERPAILLLRHIVELWPGDAPFWATTTLVDTLVAEHPEVWGEESGYGKALTPQRMGKMLVSSYRIRSTKEDIADKNSTRGYRRDQFRSAIGALHSRSDGVAHDDTPTLPKPSGPSEPAEPSEVATGYRRSHSAEPEGATGHGGDQFAKPATVCTVCAEPLHRLDIAEGADRHAGCIPSGWAS